MREKKPTREKIYIYGTHALLEALTNAPGAVKKAFIARTMPNAHLRSLLASHHIPVAELAVKTAGSLVGRDAVHQGVIALIDPATLMQPLDRFLAALDLSKRPAVVLLAELTDPGNVGAIIRSAAAFGLSGVLIPERRQAPITGTVVKASAGMVFRLPLVAIGNVNHALAKLKEHGFWVYGLAGDGTTPLHTEPFEKPSVIVVGNEGEGLREKTREACDIILSIPIHSRAESLNAAAAAAVTFAAWSTAHQEALV